ncbi:hypothetical protein FGKAn22_19260 [Ferrigenium kumadai]|uniref:Uncharacterized protein n=1 Tax=Ferrigenium kumadai TaxID=1682490 RepID=A0AAN1W099_9PROT|nr:hypothetical protein [Ferrigenium kumadai]BBJ00234.1 hypothetical protein FGKAn22_19260 [Ferrigenium kumadai]
MKTRLGIFVLALLLLPFAGMLLSGKEWSELASFAAQTDGTAATVIVALALLCALLLTNLVVTLRTGNNPLKVQRNYFLAVGSASAMLGWLLAYLNHYAASWSAAQENTVWQIALDTLLFALLAPAVLSLRALLGSFAGLLQRLARGPSIPAPSAETQAFILTPLAALGLIGGAAWPAQLFWLLWLSPLLLLAALQLLWHESTVFSGVKSGDWGRAVCAAISGLVVGNLAVFGYQAVGGELQVNLLLAQAGYILFGLLCLQLGDIIAEQWRGKTRFELFKRKPFPIPVTTKK